jgi:hypothetical protein
VGIFYAWAGYFRTSVGQGEPDGARVERLRTYAELDTAHASSRTVGVDRPGGCEPRPVASVGGLRGAVVGVSAPYRPTGSQRMVMDPQAFCLCRVPGPQEVTKLSGAFARPLRLSSRVPRESFNYVLKHCRGMNPPEAFRIASISHL